MLNARIRVLLRSAEGGLAGAARQKSGRASGGEVKKNSFCSDPSSEAVVLWPRIYHFVINMASRLARFFPLIKGICL